MFCCIFIPDFPVAAILRFEPELRACPVAVLVGRPPLEKVFALSEKARQDGVEVGATRAQVEAWKELALRARSLSQEESARAALLDCAGYFSPEVEDTAPDTVLLNLAGLEPLFGPLSKIAHDIAHRIAQLKLESNVAVASNPDAAILTARGFPGVTLVPQGCEAKSLRDLPVEVLLDSFARDAQEAEQWLEIFDRWGISRLRELAALPAVPLSERLGQQGIRLQNLARGAVSRTLRLYAAPPAFAESVELEYPILLLEPLAFVLNRMLEQVCARLGNWALAAQELELKLELDPGRESYEESDASTSPQKNRMTFTRSLRLPAPMLDVKTFLKLLQLDLQAHPPGAPIVKIHLSAQPARPRVTQSGLFHPAAPEPEKLELTLARIAAVVGQGRVGSVELLDTHREDAFEMRHFAPVEPESSSNSLADDAQEKMSAVIALRLFRPPLRAAITLREGKPARLQCSHDNIDAQIVWTAGPWRSSGDWAEQEGWSREEWDIAVSAESGLLLYRLVQDKLNGKWFVEGVYD